MAIREISGTLKLNAATQENLEKNQKSSKMNFLENREELPRKGYFNFLKYNSLIIFKKR